MTDFITLRCPSCGAKLQVTKDLNQFICESCGNEHLINHGGGVITIQPIIEGLSNIKTGVDKTAAELAINRLSMEIKEIEGEYNRVLEKSRKLNGVFLVAGLLLVLGLFMLFTSNGVVSILITGLIMSLVGAGLFYVTYISRKGYQKQCENILQKARVMKKDLEKHRELVSS